jgi:S-(hydroxymethyl)glutathione dehydrogenase/alcohol dehydrogenase
MRAAIFTSVETGLTVETVKMLDPGSADVVVRLGASGVCHSDLSVLNGTVAYPAVPVVLGHEGAGTVEWTGAGVSRFKVGDRVIASFGAVCGHCGHCTHQETHLCASASMDLMTARVQREDGSTAHGMAGLGTFAEAMTCNEAALVAIRTDLPDEQLALIGCGATTGLGAALNTAQVHAGATVAVLGCGGVGTAVIQGARIAGAAQIFAVDPVAGKRTAALGFGATHGIDPATGDAAEQILALTDGRGVDFVFEAAGVEALMEQGMRMTRRGGTLVLVGLPQPTAALNVSAAQFVCSDRRIMGSYYGGAQILRDFPRFVSLVETGRLDLGGMISKRFPLERVGDAFDEMKNGTAIRSVLTL